MSERNENPQQQQQVSPEFIDKFLSNLREKLVVEIQKTTFLETQMQFKDSEISRLTDQTNSMKNGEVTDSSG